MNYIRIFACCCFCLFCSVTIAQKEMTFRSLRLMGEKVIPHNASFQQTTIGGLSGIDYDADQQLYYILSDDRSAINPARFYTAKIQFSLNGIDSVMFLSVQSLLQQNGKPFPSGKVNPALAPDPESIRYNKKTNQLVWSSEGERNANHVLVNPSINFIQTDGTWLETLDIPANLTMNSTEKGPRQNGALEGISFAQDYNLLYAAMEEPLYEDGPRADITVTKSWTRIYRFDTKTKKNNAQYAYPLEPIAYPPLLSGSLKINGISEILAIQSNQLLVVERSFSTGRMACTIKVFLADLSVADNVINTSSLQESPPTHLVTKKLILNMDELGLHIDNIEGITFGPTLPNGHQTLVFVADNNFLSIQKTQFLLFEVMP
jgi:hypothetical protein